MQFKGALLVEFVAGRKVRPKKGAAQCQSAAAKVDVIINNKQLIVFFIIFFSLPF